MTSGGGPDAAASATAAGDAHAPVRLLRAMGITGAGTAAALLIGIATNKALALLIGPAGLGVVSQLQVLRALVMSVVAAGLAASFTRFIAQLTARGREGDANRLVRSGLAFALVLGLGVSGVGWLAREDLARSLLGGPVYGGAVAATTLGGAVGGAALVLQGALNGYREIGALAAAAAAVSAANLVLMAALGAAFGTTGAAAAVGLLPVFNFAIYACALKLRGHRPLGAGRPGLGMLRAPLQFGAAALGADFLKNATFLGSRRAVIAAFGFAGNGWYQAVLTLSDQYFNVLTSAVATYVLPTLAGHRDDVARTAEMNRVGRAMFLLLVPVLVVMLLFQDWLVRLLYSRDFLAATGILQWQLVGGSFRMAGWTLGAPLLVVASPAFVLVQEIVWDMLYLAGVILLPRTLGIAGVGVAFAVASALHAGLLAVYMRRRMAFRWSPTNRVLLVTSFAVVATAAALAHRGLLGVATALLGFTAWLVVNVRASDRAHLRQMLRTLVGRHEWPGR